MVHLWDWVRGIDCGSPAAGRYLDGVVVCESVLLMDSFFLV